MEKIQRVLSIKKRWLFLAYLIIVIFCSFVYMLYWWIEPNSFIVNERIGDYFMTFEQSDVGSEDSMPIYYQYRKIRNITEKRLAIYSEIKKKEKEEKSLYDTLKLLNNQSWQGIDSACGDDCLQKIQPQIKHLDSLERVCSWIENFVADNDSISKSLSDNLKDLQHRVKNEKTLAEIKLLRKYEYESHYSNDFLEKEKERVVEKSRQVRDQINDLYNDSLTQNTHQWYEDSWKVREILRKKVSWMDFFYYSLGIATTTTFGDLVANDYVTKILSAIELLLCLALVTFLLNIPQFFIISKEMVDRLGKDKE